MITSFAVHSPITSKKDSTNKLTMFWECLCPPYIRFQLAHLFPQKSHPKIPESKLVLPRSKLPVIDSHSHLLSTYFAYKTEYPDGKFAGSVHDFVRGFYGGKNIEAIVDVWWEVPVRKEWKALADSAVNSQLWCGIEYYCTIGVSSQTVLCGAD